MQRCPWPAEDPLMIEYHDHEWGVPVYDDTKHFEFMVLDLFQAGLSWRTVLYKREHFREAFDNFDVEKITAYNDLKVQGLLDNKNIIRNRLKIMAVIHNADRFIEIQKQYGSFNEYIWQFAGGKPIINTWKQLKELPTSTKESDKMSQDLMKKGFKFVGSTICYAYMQAAGLVNDHLVSCYRYKELI
ncbi:MAG: DNA-3-methyladenine glycosylase [Bacteroides sp. SM23_62_1]|nr:MAG: DNA-3-methyladenine glycosylase [Bacteroides sp. SM23_62_1]